MKAAGLITEYNPLHKGHIYHLNQSKYKTGADCVIAVMSGSYVQRGEPALVDKHLRCRAAIDSGINLIVELPVMYALSSAEGFAQGAIATLAALQTDYVVFGSECGNLDILKTIADILANETPAFKDLISGYVSCGISYPAARQKALEAMYSDLFLDKYSLDLTDILSCPNNILGIEYLKAVRKLNSSIKPYTITRKGTGYNQSEITGLPSASAIRSILLEPSGHVPSFNCGKKLTAISNLIPPAMYNNLAKAAASGYMPLQLDDYTLLFNMTMNNIFYNCHYNKNKVTDILVSYIDISADLANRMYNAFEGCQPLSAFCAKVKSRQYTYSRITRAVMHIILGLTNEKYEAYSKSQPPYIRILGFDSTGARYLSSIRKECLVPVITKVSDYSELLYDDIHCSHIYNEVLYEKCGYRLKDEYRCGVYVKK
ncbi:MAG: nucleotidyltransferase family protein [Eubacteriales bacterium]|nr:nucleotidyltransferase family protein [Eubacteriales bacterium]